MLVLSAASFIFEPLLSSGGMERHDLTQLHTPARDLMVSESE